MSGSRAVSRAGSGTAGWKAAAAAQLGARPAHEDFYALCADMVATLFALDDLARVVTDQVAGYGRGRAVYDDSRDLHGGSGAVDPRVRLREAARALRGARRSLVAAAGSVNAAWSAIGHIGVDPDPNRAPDRRGRR